MKDTGNEEKSKHTRNRKIKSEGFKHDELLRNGKTKLSNKASHIVSC